MVTPLAVGAAATFDALMAGRLIWTRGSDRPADPTSLVRRVGTSALASDGREAMPEAPAAAMGEQAAREACREAGVDPRGLPLVLGSSKGEVEALTRRVPEAVAVGPHGYLAGRLQHRLGADTVRVAVAACASGLVALDVARRWLLYGRPRPPSAVLVVATDASLAEPFVQSYRRLGVLAPPVPGRYVQRPLARRREGFVLAESAAAVVLRRGGTGNLRLVSTAVGSECHDVVRPAPDPAALRHCASTLMEGRRITMVHPHAPGIEQDATEMACYQPWLSPGAGVYACKGALGHSLGAAGLVAFVTACLCARSGCRPPMDWIDLPMAGIEALLRGGKNGDTAVHAVFASGFGGHTAGALLEKNFGKAVDLRCERS